MSWACMGTAACTLVTGGGPSGAGACSRLQSRLCTCALSSAPVSCMADANQPKVNQHHHACWFLGLSCRDLGCHRLSTGVMRLCIPARMICCMHGLRLRALTPTAHLRSCAFLKSAKVLPCMHAVLLQGRHGQASCSPGRLRQPPP